MPLTRALWAVPGRIAFATYRENRKVAEEQSNVDWRTATSRWPSLDALTNDAYRESIDRVRGLEAKLRSWLQFILLALSVVVSLAIHSVQSGSLAAFVLFVAAVCHLATALAVVARGGDTQTMAFIGIEPVAGSIARGVDPMADIPSLRVSAARTNDALGVRLANLVWCAKTSILWSFVYLFLAALVIALR